MSASLRNSIFVMLGILFLSLNLRGPFTSLAPVLSQVMEGLSLNSSAAGFLTALPLLTFALFSPLVTKISQRIGLEPSLLLALVLITAGITLRSFGAIPTLYIGTVMIGLGIAIGNVLLPVVVKISFPTRIATVTSLYIFTMGIGSTLGSSLMVPFSELTLFTLTGWQLALLMNLVFPLLALIIWLPKITKRSSSKSTKQNEENPVPMKKMVKSGVAWQVTLALGLNSFTFYSLAGWLPQILNDLGYSEIDAGYIYGFLQFSTMVPGLLLLPFLGKSNNQRWLITLCTSSVFIGLIGLLYLPDFAIFWVGLFGLANCSTFIIALSFVGLRTSNSSQAASLSGMAQGIGYALAATGPTLVGKLHSQTGSWSVPILLIAGVAFACTIFAALAARDTKVSV
ncbi:2-nitroimidazole transporter [Vibrio crassostreae]|uniref:MFS transporter n=1 Tax=Vibrio crassostreae TaxID=246167 RepID=UPI000F4AC7B0|nr:MFS transporter [Vibrio crassostreae]ROO65335.1 CP family cyanate transporter-like MFS transporter [Vibrio crassostreae]CAK2124319.1 2-nitroimidazole transporter [Vibrio crassostreae]CAK2148314.1 2-nitroimidazole transporter [Vibrio crassostreae]CAK3012630.1 2-nitroimidazole transporter [Vibrio crassostreae]CAK3529584.1 2-nitroimidazole transporter [Vibrio crassostreae]